MKKTLFIKNAAVLTVASLVLRFAGIVFKIFLAKKIGASGIGLYGLVFSLYLVASAGTTSGLPVAVTRLVSESGGRENKNYESILSAAFRLNLIVSLVTGAVLFFGADFLAARFIGDIRGSFSLKILAFSVVFTGLGAVIRGYFIARRKAWPNAISLIAEQAIRIGFVLFALNIASGKGLHKTVAAVFLGDTAAQIVSCCYLYIRYRIDKRRIKPSSPCPRPLRRIFDISFPITAGKYLNSFLRAAENVLVPRALSRFSKSGALALFGMIKGMTLPILFFPSVLLNAVSTLLVPEMSEAALARRTTTVRLAVEQVICAALTVGFIFSAIFAAAGYKVGFLLYKSGDVGFLITALSPIVPLMYVDSLCDGLLKGLNQQKFTFRLSVSDSVLRLIFIYPVLSRFGIKGFIAIMYVSNLFTALLNTRRLLKISGARVDPQKTVVSPLLSAFCVTLLTKIVLDFFTLPDLVYIILLCAVSMLSYLLLLIHFDCINFWITGRMRAHKKYAPKTIARSLIK